MTQPANARRFLLPLTPLYRVGLVLRELRLRSGIEPVRSLDHPVISVGSLSAGGSGKTPFVIALAQALMRRGMHVDVLSRGYGRCSNAALRVDPGGSAEEFGDEPLLIAREAGIPVYVAAQRYEAGLLAESELKSDVRAVHLLDDGFQHRQLNRSVNILMLDSRDLRDHLLPAGNLREPLGSMYRAHAIAVPAEDSDAAKHAKNSSWKGPVWRLRRRMQAPRIDGPVVAFCGIARSDQFFAGLEASGLHLASRIAFPDHHRYIQHDIDCILGAARSINATAFITTEKDQVRLSKFVSQFSESGPLKTARLTIEIEDEDAVVNWVCERISRTLR